jgi:hypothetical protein
MAYQLGLRRFSARILSFYVSVTLASSIVLAYLHSTGALLSYTRDAQVMAAVDEAFPGQIAGGGFGRAERTGAQET